MWIKFRNDVMVNMEHILSVTHSEYGHTLIFQGNAGYACTLEFLGETDIENTISAITKALEEKETMVHINASPSI